MFKYLFSNDWRVSQMPGILAFAAEYQLTGIVPTDAPENFLSNIEPVHRYYLALDKLSNNARLIREARWQEVLLNFVNKFQYPNARTEDSYNDAIREGIRVAPLREAVKLLYVLTLIDPSQAYLTNIELCDFILYNDAVTKVTSINRVNVAQSIIQYRSTGCYPTTIDTTARSSWSKIELRYLSEMMGVMAASGCVKIEEASRGIKRISLSLEEMNSSARGLVADILSCDEFWIPPPTSDFMEIKLSCMCYSDTHLSDEETFLYMQDLSRDDQFRKWMLYIAGKSNKTANSYVVYLNSLNKPVGAPKNSVWPGLYCHVMGQSAPRAVFDVEGLADFESIYGWIRNVLDGVTAVPKGARPTEYQAAVSWAAQPSVKSKANLSSAYDSYVKFLKWFYEQKKILAERNPLSSGADKLTVALKLFAEKRSVDKPSGWDSYDAWTHGVRTDFVVVDESLLTDPAFDYHAYIRKFAISWTVADTKFAGHSNSEKHDVLKFLKEQKWSPKSASWYIDETNRLVVGGSRVKGMAPMTVLYFMSELHPEEFAAWTKPTYENLTFLGLHKGPVPLDLTIETYEDCKSKQQQIVARMKELGIGKASDDSSDPDYRTANEFLWWLGQDDNKDLIKEKVMSKAMKKPTAKKITTGKAEISELLGSKEDSLMTMLIAGLLTKPLAILAGVSGTGKSRMVRHLAYKTCLDEDLKPNGESAPGNFKMVQVKPSWHDSADLLGYRSAVNEKHEYVSTDFVKFVLRAHAYPKTPFFVCLDEMNLAPVEHYFAEFLSACESIRKSDVTGEWTSDPIVAATDFDNNVLNLGGDVLFESSDATLDAELKKTKARIEKEGLFIPRNLFVVGTVNMDDSTGGFSRKVLDRAMTIVMNEVHFEDLQKDDKDLTLSDDNLFKTDEIAKFIERKDFNKDMLENDFRDQLEDIRQKLEKTPFALAYRFARETCMYKNALKEILDTAAVIKDSEGNPKKDASGTAIGADRACGDIALDHMILMKLLPRLTGTTEQRKQVIEDINAFLDLLIKEKRVSKETLKDMVDRAGGNGGYLSFWP